MRRFTNTLISWGPAGLLILAFIDGVGLPNPGGPDALLLLLAAVNPDTAYLSAAMAIIGSVVGTMILFSLARKGGEAYLARYTSTGRGARFRRWFQRYGLLTVFVPGMIPIPTPFKVFIICSGALGTRPSTFLAVLVVARVGRYLGLAYLGAQLGKNSLSWLKVHAWELIGFAVVVFAALYVAVRIADRNRGARG